MGYGAVACTVPVKAGAVIEPNAPLGQLQLMNIGAPPFRCWGESTMIPDKFEIQKQSRQWGAPPFCQEDGGYPTMEKIKWAQFTGAIYCGR